MAGDSGRQGWSFGMTWLGLSVVEELSRSVELCVMEDILNEGGRYWMSIERAGREPIA